MNKKSFFFVSQVFYPDEVSTAGLFTDLCIELSENEVEVTVWCSQPSYTTNKKQPRQIRYKGISIKYLRATNFKKDNKFGRIINYISFSLTKLFSLKFFFLNNPSFCQCGT